MYHSLAFNPAGVAVAALSVMLASKSHAVDPSGVTINREALRRAVAEIESSNGVNIGPRYEPAFYAKYKKKGMMPKLIMKFGKKPPASSYGKYQIMLVVAWEYGFEFTPDELADETNNTTVYNAIAEKIISKVGDDEVYIKDFGKRYNGSAAYGEKLKEMYGRFANEQ